MERTTDLFSELSQMDDSVEAFQSFRERHPAANDTLAGFLNSYIGAHSDLDTKTIIQDANLSKDYANQFFNGTRKHPAKYKLIPICIAMGMNTKETNYALFLAGQPALTPKLDLDAALIICINHDYRTMNRVNAYLQTLGLETI